ncbi:hypothetical protein CR513_40489, partial [Mucuna pruriens]
MGLSSRGQNCKEIEPNLNENPLMDLDPSKMKPPALGHLRGLIPSTSTKIRNTSLHPYMPDPFWLPPCYPHWLYSGSMSSIFSQLHAGPSMSFSFVQFLSWPRADSNINIQLCAVYTSIYLRVISQILFHPHVISKSRLNVVFNEASKQPQVNPYHTTSDPAQQQSQTFIPSRAHPTPPQDEDFQSAKMLQLLEERMDALEGTKQSDFDATNLCLVPNINVPPSSRCSV